VAKIALLTSGQVGRDLIHSLRYFPNILPVFDKSFSRSKFLIIFKRRSINFKIFLNILGSEVLFFNAMTFLRYRNIPKIDNNSDLRELVYKHNFTHVVLFNASLIIEPSIFDPGVELLNIHCINPDLYPGLGSIEKALADKNLVQFAALHQITSTIDKGSIILKNPYELKMSESSLKNRKIAFNAGIELFHIWFNNLK
jgi:hypothetical protein